MNKERKSGLYHLSSYYCAKMISEVPYILLEPVAYGTVVFFVTNMAGIESFFQTILVLVLLSLASQVFKSIIGVKYI